MPEQIRYHHERACPGRGRNGGLAGRELEKVCRQRLNHAQFKPIGEVTMGYFMVEARQSNRPPANGDDRPGWRHQQLLLPPHAHRPVAPRRHR